MKRILALLLALSMVFAFAACGSEDNGSNDGNEGTSGNEGGNAGDATADYKIGVILLGDENEGYTYAHIEGIRAAMETLNVPEENVIWKYSVPENENCYDAAVDLAEQGCTHIFSNSYGHQSFMVQAAGEFPDVTFCVGTGDTAATCGLSNVKNYFNYTFEARYVSGVVAGMKLKELMDSGEVTDPHIGYVGAYPYAEVVSGYTAFLLGIQSIVPEAYMDVVYTSSWFDPTAEAEAANALIAMGCVIVSAHADSTGAPSACQAALEAGTTVYSIGYNIDMLSVAPDAALTSATNVWAVYYTYAFDLIMKGEEIPTDWAAGFNEDAVSITALGPSCAEGTAEKVAEVEAAIKNGELHVFDTSTFTVGGEHIDSYTNAYGLEGQETISDGYFHESELRSAPYFDIRIDGITEN